MNFTVRNSSTSPRRSISPEKATYRKVSPSDSTSALSVRGDAPTLEPGAAMRTPDAAAPVSSDQTGTATSEKFVLCFDWFKEIDEIKEEAAESTPAQEPGASTRTPDAAAPVSSDQTGTATSEKFVLCFDWFKEIDKTKEEAAESTPAQEPGAATRTPNAAAPVYLDNNQR